MGGFSLGVAIEMLVAILLAVTIGYCVLVNRKLVQLRSDQSELKSIVRDLHLATHQAEHAIAGLRETAASSEESLGHQIERVRNLDKQLRVNIGRGDALIAKLAAISHAERMRRPPPAEPEPVPEAEPKEKTARPRASSIGLGLLNAQRRNTATQQSGEHGPQERAA